MQRSLQRSDVFVILFGISAIIGAFFVAKYYSLWVLVPLPSVIALVYHLLNLSLRFDSRKHDVGTYRNFAAEFLAAWRGDEMPVTLAADLDADLERLRPTLPSMIWACALLTAVFALPVIISAGGSRLGQFDNSKVADVSSALKNAQSATTIDGAKKAVSTAQKVVQEAAQRLPEWQRGIVFAGFGVWVLIVLRTIGRINAGALSARFLINASLRAGASMMLGFFFAASEYFSTADLAGVGLTTTYFLIGLFYPLFFEQLRDTALKLTKRNKNITSDMPSNWVDGVDDDTQDILTEVNVISVQHLATADPGLLTVRTLFEFDRVFDFVNQAMLIDHFREKIVDLRLLRLRGITDFVTAVEPAISRSAGRNDADALIKQIVAATGKSEAEVLSFTRTRMKDFRTNLFIGLVQMRKPATGALVQQVAPIVGNADPRIPIQGEGHASFEAFVPRAVKSRLEDELREEARRDAERFRAENPDAQPDDDIIAQRYDNAYKVALERATIGANPKPGKHTREVYADTFRSALS